MTTSTPKRSARRIQTRRRGETAGLIPYYRVSTKQQGASGLGLDAQREMIARYAQSKSLPVLAEFTEVETGKRSDRAQLDAALRQCKRDGATLVIAKLDRLSRNVHFLSGLMDSDVPFVVVDNPEANRLTLHILAAVAEEEARLISERTKAGLAQAKKRGTLLGSARPGFWDGRDRTQAPAKAVAEVIRASRERRDEAYKDVILPLAVKMRSEGATLQEVADALNAKGLLTVWGAKWHIMYVKRMLMRYGVYKGREVASQPASAQAEGADSDGAP